MASAATGGGVVDIVISPGSRSTPLALTLHAHPGLRTWIQIDERAAGFFALGQARATGRPSVLVCTSGTAAANYLVELVAFETTDDNGSRTNAQSTRVGTVLANASGTVTTTDMSEGGSVSFTPLAGDATR